MADFKQELAERCRLLAVKYNYRPDDLPRGFEALAVHIATSEPGFQGALGGEDIFKADLSEYIVRQNDGEVDGVLENEGDRELLLIQAHYGTKNKKPDEKKVRAFLQTVNSVTGPRRDDFLSHLSPQAQLLLGGIEERLDQGWSVALRFVTNLPVDARLQALFNTQQDSYRSAKLAVTCELAGQDDFKRVWDEVVGGTRVVIDEVRLKLRAGYSLGFEAGKLRFPTLVALISGNELRNLYKQHGNSLFALNIRLPMHLSKQVNPAIAETARKQANSFFYFNNGVSAVCDSFSTTAGEVTAKRFQIINGAQTVGTLGLLSTDPNSVDVLFRLTACGPDQVQFRDDVTRTNNTQNQVIPWDFRSNDPIQRFLEEQVSNYSGKGPIPSVYYRPKRGIDAGSKGGKAIEPEYLGRLRHAYLYGPVVSYREPKLLASAEPSVGKYWEAFGLDGTEAVVWPKTQMEEAMFIVALDSRLVLEAETYKKNGHAYGRWLKRLSRFVVGAVGEYRRSAPEKQKPYTKLLHMSEDEFWKEHRPVVLEISDKINSEYELLVGQKVQPEYKIARDEEFFDRMSKGVTAKLTA